MESVVDVRDTLAATKLYKELTRNGRIPISYYLAADRKMERGTQGATA